ncbi:olfactory receptor 10A7-like [Hyla sarda]|uniref:olfactory receptor 10A7-like n=1 Tax=Hyla sarda TaxID=327740 RepID=UPI0024C3FB2F|nr:olfactory receptor 10A7-like [Hyla sarda]
MCEENKTKVTEFHLLGFRNLYNFRTFFFIVLLAIYSVIVVGNLLIILLVSFIDHLQIPMFYFLKHLAVADLLLTTTVVPVMLDIILKEGAVISVIGCLIHLCVYGIFGSVQCFVLAVMSYDRYLAICNPLHYVFLMNPNKCLQLVFGSWSLVVTLTLSEIVSIGQFEFCGLNTIDHFVCDFRPVIELITSNSSIIIIGDFVISGFMSLFPFAFIIIAYIYIVITILKISSSTGRKKVFSTCSSHLITVCTFYGTLITIYLSPSDKSHGDVNMYLSLLYLVVTPFMNPIIYSLRNHQIKTSIKKVLIRTMMVLEGQ